MLFDSTVRKEIGRSFAATLVVLLTIVITMMLIRVLGQAAGGQIDPQDVVLLLGYAALGYLPTVLSLSVFIAIVVVIGRMYRDSEMAIWFTSGIGLLRFLRPVLWLSVPILGMAGVGSLWLWPWTNVQTQELRSRYQQRSDLARVTPGVFQVSADGRRVFFIDRETQDDLKVKRVFILSDTPAAESVTSAQGGHVEQRADDRVVVLERGQRTERNKKPGDQTVAQFETFEMLTDERKVSGTGGRDARALSTQELLMAPTAVNRGELTWRVGVVLSAANLTLLGLGLAATSPRRPSNWSLVFALLAFVVYSNLVNLSQSWVTSERLSVTAALLSLHGGALALALALLVWREEAIRWPPRGWWMRPRPSV